MPETVIQRAASILRSGGLVAFPTETVYGLGADASNAVAVGKIFAVKGRPQTNPLIVHVADAGIARRFTTRWPDAAAALAAKYWPGPLTLVLPKTPDIPDVVTAGRTTVALRAPDHPVALALLQTFGGPVAAPSANRSNRVSPTAAQHVRDEIGDAVDLILDGGPCKVGIESTVLDLSANVPRILRPGAVTREQIERIVGPVEFVVGLGDAGVPAASPGRHAVHYAPRTRAFRFESSERATVPPDVKSGRIVLATSASDPNDQRGPTVIMPRDPASYARRLYEVLREQDAAGFAALYIEMPPDTPEWTAVRDRLMRATVPMPT